jgi:hypothetical protein
MFSKYEIAKKAMRITYQHIERPKSFSYHKKDLNDQHYHTQRNQKKWKEFIRSITDFFLYIQNYKNIKYA